MPPDHPITPRRDNGQWYLVFYQDTPSQPLTSAAPNDAEPPTQRPCQIPSYAVPSDT
jgi:hypothetical protein